MFFVCVLPPCVRSHAKCVTDRLSLLSLLSACQVKSSRPISTQVGFPGVCCSFAGLISFNSIRFDSKVLDAYSKGRSKSNAETAAEEAAQRLWR